MAIQTVIDNTEWVSQSGNPVAYAPHLRRSPLDQTDQDRVRRLVENARDPGNGRCLPLPPSVARLSSGCAKTRLPTGHAAGATSDTVVISAGHPTRTG